MRLLSDIDLSDHIVVEALQKGFMPDPDRTVTEWADECRFLPKESSSEPGKYRSSRTPYLKEIMDALSNASGVDEICVMKATQLGMTEVGNNWFGYVVDVAPGPMMMIFPTGDLATDHSKQKLAPSIRETPQLRAKIKESRIRDSGNTIQVKQFPGGILYLYGANSPVSFRSRTIRYLFLDDLDGYPGDVGGEGDPVNLAKKRTDTYSIRKKIYLVSTPTIKGRSRIEALFLASDQRYYHVPCPHCGKLQVLEWGGKKADYGIRFIRDEAGGVNYVYYQCRHCKNVIEEKHKTWMLENGKWIAKHPERKRRGYHLSSLYSPLGWVSWTQIVVEFLEAVGDPEAMQVWQNTRLGEVYEVAGSRDADDLYKLTDDRPAGLVPSEGVLGLTGGIDTQDHGFYYVIRAWGRGFESWLVRYGFIVEFALLEQVILNSVYSDANGNEYPVLFSFQDAMGHRTKEVYDFCRVRDGICAARGVDQMAQKVRVSNIDTYPGTNKPIPGGVKLYNLNTTFFKNSLSNRIKIGPADPGAFHLHSEIDADYVQQMTAEFINEKGHWECPASRSNHYWDSEILAYAAADYIGLIHFNQNPAESHFPASKTSSPKPASHSRGRTINPWKRR